MKVTVKNSVFIIGLVLLCMILGCRPAVKEDISSFTSLKKLHESEYPKFTDNLDPAGLLKSIDQSLIYFNRVPKDRKYHYGREIYTAGHMIQSLETFKSFLASGPSSGKLDRFIRRNFDVYESVGNDSGQILFTGYFEPIYEGSLEQSPDYPYPVYTRPEDLLQIDLSSFSDAYKGHKRLVARVDTQKKSVVPYYTREEINQTEDFHERSEPLVWLRSRVDRFFLEIQGSGRVMLEDGSQMRLHYAASNGNAYRSIGRYLIEEDEIPRESMSMQAIREWLDRHPERMDEVLNYNESFVFFNTEQGGPYGSIGVEVTPFRSIATDSRLFPKGALGFIRTELPDRVNINPLKRWEPQTFFVMNQDTGGAIKGPARADIFCGNGHYAKFTAGHMKVYGRMFFLVLKD